MSRQFTGAYSRALDAKNRISLPPKFLRALEADGGSFWLTAFYGRLTAYAPGRWEDIVESLCRIQLPSRNLANFKSRLIGLAEEMRPDAQGRVRISPPLIRAGGLGREVTLVGMMDKFEIWDQARFDAVETEDVSGELAASGVEIFL